MKFLLFALLFFLWPLSLTLLPLFTLFFIIVLLSLVLYAFIYYLKAYYDPRRRKLRALLKHNLRHLP
ncbi:MAG: hypothetical protein N2327_06425 [Caldimicrobium sp.]|nr:hypothetical protein [Caldimicrobium sp.]MCX7874047.1 hypothetical protein [Caldimicrobium sp.]MDW8093871.1 hypothetical protein [Caldimicrobium sp.]